MTVSDKCKLGAAVYSIAPSVLKGLKNNKLESGMWYVVTTAPEKEETLYVLSRSELGNGLYDKLNLHVVALAGSQTEAFGLITQMVQEASDQGRLYELKHYFLEY